MPVSWERPGLNIPESVKSMFACAVWDFRNDKLPPEGQRILETTYYHEANFMEAVEEIYKANFWPFDRPVKTKFRALFRERKSAG